MSSNNNPSLTSLDFDAIKQDLINYLSSQPQFQGYNFQGAALNILMDILAYNTHYNAYYLNMIANEMFLDSSVLRQSVVSHAKSLGYTPRSVTSAQAVVNVSITRAATDNTSILTLPRFTQFSTPSVDGTTYTFVTLDNQTVTASGNTFNFSNVTLKEGTPVVKTFLVNNAQNPTQTFDLVDQNIDTSTLQVIVQKSPTNIQQTVFNLAEDAATVASNSNIYFLQEGSNYNYQIYFGDGVIGSSLVDNNILIVSYLTSSADAANYMNNFTLVSNPLAGGNSNVTTVTESYGGTPIEDVSSVKFNAPKSWVAQNRAVTVNDYIALINKNYPYFDAVTVWGGETENPPVYGKVFISAKPKNSFAITETQKEYLLKNVIGPISVLTVSPEFVDVDYNFINLNLTVEYDSTQTVSNPGQLRDTVISAVNNYANLNLNTFNSEFRLSRLLRAIDDADVSILSSTATIYLEKRFTPVLGVSTTYTLQTGGIPIHRGTVNDRLYSSPAFVINDLSGVSRNAYIEETPESFSGIESISIITPGNGYITAPTLTITGDGTGANAYATIVNGKVANVVIDSQGSNYTQATITATGGGGSGATFSTILQGKTGTLRTYYFDQNNNKIILNVNAGTIDYINGIITLTNFNPTDVLSIDGSLSIIFEPESMSFTSNKSNILTIDSTDINSVTVNLIDEAS